MVWAIGDLQGCYRSFRHLLESIAFDAKRDTLWLTGDLVNRGDGSLETLRYLYDHQDAIKAVLGNHDITLLAAYYGIKRSNPSIDPILNAHDAKDLIEWLRGLPFLHLDYRLGYVMAHAGISPQFDLGMAIRFAKRIEEKLRGDNPKGWLKTLFKESNGRFLRFGSDKELDRYILDSFTRMRFCDDRFRLDFKQKGAPSPELEKVGLVPWFRCKKRLPIELKIVFGHWSTLGYFENEDVVCLDTGCVWGRRLTAKRLDTDGTQIVQVVCDPTRLDD